MTQMSKHTFILSALGFAAIIDGKMDDYPESAFFNVGTLEDVVRKAEQMKEE